MKESVLVYTAHVPVRTRSAVLGIVAAVVACSQPAPQQKPAVPVTVAVAYRGAAPRVVTANGQIDPLETARVAAQVSGLITEVAFHEGDWVRQGQVLFRIDPRPYTDALAQAQAALARDTATAAYARRYADRLDALARKDYVTKSDAESQAATAAASAATVASDAAMIRKAQFDLANTVIRAPISGRTGSLLIHRGNLVQADPNLPLVVINRTDPILVRFSVPASVFEDLQIAGRPKPLPVRVWPTDPGTAPGSTAPNSAAADTSLHLTIAADTASARDAHGTLTFVDNAVDTTTGTVRLKAQLANHNGQLWPGQFAFIALQLSVQQHALLIPSQAVQLGQQPAVYVVQPDSQAVRRPVTLGATVGRFVVVTSGLADGERVITDGQSRLTAGARVRVTGVDSTATATVAVAP
jgi:membrane fusion protein, multidrug efflux system